MLTVEEVAVADSKKSYEITLSKGRGDRCMLCPTPVSKSEFCVRFQTKIPKIISISVDEDLHLYCFAQFHHDGGEVLEQAKKLSEPGTQRTVS